MTQLGPSPSDTAAAALGCLGYGSVFLAVGLYVRNPIVPAAVLLAWEGVNTAFVLWIAGRAVRRMQISCGADT